MKTLSLSRPLLLILVGLPGAGKSFFARQFSEMFGAPLVSFDRLRFELFAKTHLKPDEHTIVRRLATYQMEELVKTRRSFLVDGGSNTLIERQTLEQLAKKYGYGTFVIWVQTDETTSRTRATKRNDKRIDDSLSPSMSEIEWAALGKRFQQPGREAHMVISGKHAFGTQAKMVLRRLTAHHVKEAETAHQEKNQARPTRQPKREPPVPKVARPATAARASRRSVIIS